MLKVGPVLNELVDQMERERGIPRELVLDSLREAMVAAYRRYASLPTGDGIVCHLFERTGEIGLFKQQEVVEQLDEPTEEQPYPEAIQIDLAEARRLKPDAEVGDILEIEVTPNDFGRIAAQAAKQVINQRIREVEKMLVQREFEDKRGTVMTAIVSRLEGRNVVVQLGKTEAIMPPREQLPGSYYRIGDKVRVYVADLSTHVSRVPQIIVSQAHPAMVKEIFELEVPEIEDGIVEIRSIAREAGHRTKVAVWSNDPDVDPQGACIGARGSRIQTIVNELRNEKIDIIRWSDDPAMFVTNALSPARIVKVEVMQEATGQLRALVVVPDDQLSLAIGREGQNVRLASRLTGMRLDIKSLANYEAEMAEMAEQQGSYDAAVEPGADVTEQEGEDYSHGHAEGSMYDGAVSAEALAEAEGNEDIVIEMPEVDKPLHDEALEAEGETLAEAAEEEEADQPEEQPTHS